MTQIYNRKWGETRRRALRERSTETEEMMWQRVRNRQLGYKIRRQFGVGYYILDFYIPALKLGIEIDGEIHLHPEQVLYDQRREKAINQLGIRLLHFTRISVLKNIDHVITHLKNHVFQASLPIHLRNTKE